MVAKLCLTFFETPWTVAHQAPLSMVFPRQEYWSGLPFPSPGISLTKRSNPCLLHWQADSLALSHLSSLHDISCHNSLRTGLKEMETNWSWNRRLTVPRTTSVTLVSPLMTNLKMTVRADCVVCAWSPPPLPTIALTLWLSGSGSQPLDRHHPYPRVAGIQNKANFFSPNMPLLGFWVASSWTLLFVTICSTFL